MSRFALLPVHLALAAYVAGLLLALAWRPSGGCLLVLALVAIALAVFSVLGNRRGISLIALAGGVALLFLAGGMATGTQRLHAIDASRLSPLVGQRVPVELTVTGLPTVKPRALSVPVKVQSAGEVRVDEASQLTVWTEGEDTSALTDSVAGLSEGLRLSLLRAKVEPLPPAPAEGFDYGRYLRRRGVHALVSCNLEDLRVTGRRGGLAAITDSLRRAARKNLRRGVQSPVRELLQGMVLGDDAGFDEAIADDFRRSGLMHIMAVSGENVVLVCSLLGALLASLGFGRRWRSLVLLPAIAAYVIIAGASPSVVRAGIAGGIALLAGLLARPGDVALLLLVPAAAMLTMNPYTVYDVSFQLSFAAVAGLFFLAGRLQPLFRFLPGPLREAGAMTSAASLATAPISLATFGQVSIVSLPANLAGSFVLGPVMFLGMTSAAAGFVWSGFSIALNTVSSVLIGFLVSVAHWFSSLPGAAYAWQGLTLGFVLTILLLLTVVVLPRLAARHGVGVVRYLVGGRLRGAPLLMVAAVVAAALIVIPGAPAGPSQPTVSFLDVGEGSATLVQAPGGPTVLIDGGPAPLTARLRRHGVRRIDLLVVSHGHADHIAGVRSLIGAVPVTRAFLPQPPSPEPALDELEAQLEDAGTVVRRCSVPLELDCSPFRLGVLPTRPAGDSGDANQQTNDWALVAMIALSGSNILIPGDAEADALHQLALPACDVVAAPHHGSAGGLDDELMAVLRPRLVVISVGAGNTYGHPTQETLSECADWGVPVLRTDTRGEVDLSAGASGLCVATPSQQ